METLYFILAVLTVANVIAACGDAKDPDPNDQSGDDHAIVR